jgi:hypothetical protein
MRLRLASAATGGATAATEAVDWRLRLATAATGGATTATAYYVPLSGHTKHMLLKRQQEMQQLQQEAQQLQL